MEYETHDSDPIQSKEEITFKDNYKLRHRIALDLKKEQSFSSSNSAFKQLFLTKVDCSESSFYRYLNAESTPTLDMVKMIYAFILKKPKENILLKDLPDEIKDFFTQNTTVNLKNITNLLCKSDVHRELFWLTTNNSTVNLNEFFRYHGAKKVIEAVNDLVNAGVIEYLENENYVTGSTTRAEVNVELVIDNIKHGCKIFRGSAAENAEQTNYAISGLFNVDSNGFDEIYNLFYKFEDQINEIERRNPGQQKIFIGALMENLSLCYNDIEKKELLQ